MKDMREQLSRSVLESKHLQATVSSQKELSELYMYNVHVCMWITASAYLHVVLGCCGVVVVRWSERRQLRSEALGSIPSGCPSIFFSQFVSMLICQQLLHCLLRVCAIY